MNVLLPAVALLALVNGIAKSAPLDLWDTTELRKQPLAAEKLGETRKAPLVVAGATDWMNTGDEWVAKKKDAAAAKVPASNKLLLVEEYFYNSETTPQGPNRIYCAIARPEKASGPVPVVLIFHGGGGHASPALALAAARRHPGMAGLAMDYNGQFAPGGGKHVTQWKNVGRERKLELKPDARNYPMYHNVIAARRAIDFLGTQPWADTNRIGCVGISYGGWVALILAGVDERVKCVTTAVSAGGVEFTAGKGAQQLRWEPADQRPIWLAHYEPLAYAPHTKAGVFFQLASNDLFFWLDGASRNLDALPNPKGWLVRPNSNHGAGGPEIPDTAAPAFMRHLLAGGPSLPDVTQFKVSNDGSTYTWKATGPRAITRAVLNWSPGKPVSPGRYWIEFPAERTGDTWRAKVPQEFANFAAQAFVNVGDENSVVVSSKLLTRDGLDPMTQPATQWPGGSLWDTQRGAAAWRGWQTKTVSEFAPPAGLTLGPDKGGKEFMLLSNSAVLASGVAARHKGVHLRIHGHGQPGKLKVTLLRDTNSLDEHAYAAEVAYLADASEHDIPWSAFKLATKNVTAPPMPCPFDGLMLSGERNDETPLTVTEITFTK